MQKTQQRVIYADTDAGGVVYYANYLKYFEIGRRELLRKLGIDIVNLDSKGIIVPVVEVKCNYLRPARYDDLLMIETKISQINDKSIKFEYEIKRKSDKTLLTKGYTINVFVDKNKMKSCNIPIDVKKKLKIG